MRSLPRLNDGSAPVLSLREATTDDEPFLFRVYADSRREELACVPWTDEERLTFLTSQFLAQYRYYREHYDAAEYYVVLADAEPCGRLFVAWWPHEIRIMDIALLPPFRGRGLCCHRGRAQQNDETERQEMPNAWSRPGGAAPARSGQRLHSQ